MNPNFLIIDLFCGAGGTTTGFEMTNGLAKVIACVNHDHLAIESHWKNHPEVTHFEEDIRTLDINPLNEILQKAKIQYPDALVILWASLECTNFSKAKGGLPRDADSRTLAEHLYRYIDLLNPDYIMIENVVEFMAWGPLDENGKPLSMQKGCDFIHWKQTINNRFGYVDDWAQLNSADFGAYTSRNRLFGCFAKNGLPIHFPTKQYSKKGENGLPKWKAVKEVLQLKVLGESIFKRKKPLVEKTLERIYAGLDKFVAAPFISNYKSGNPKCKNSTIDTAIGTLTTVPTQALVQSEYIMQYQSGVDPKHYVNRIKSCDEPLNTIPTNNRFALVQHFISTYYKNGSNVSVEQPAHTITTKDRLSLVTSTFILNPQFNNTGNSIEQPCPTIIATQNKRPLYKVDVAQRSAVIYTYKTDSPMMAKIKQFMRNYGIADIKMRMLFVDELKQIQGFPNEYVLLGSQAHQKKYIGNSVVPQVVKAWIESLNNYINNNKKVA